MSAKSRAVRTLSPGQRPGRAARKVWSISRFQQRFEMDEYRRQGGLDYIRMFVTATTSGKSNESTEFFQQLAELKHYYPTQYYCYFGIFWTLGSLTATKEDWLRGYLVDADLTPLNESKLAARLQLDKKLTRQALAALKRVGLIEYIDCPQFTHPQQEKAQSKDKKKTGKKAAKCAIRERSETFGNVSKHFKKKNEIGNGKSKKEKNGNAIDKLNALECQTKTKDQSRIATTESPPTTPPIKPKETDPGGSVIPVTSPLGSDKLSQPQRLGAIVRQIEHRYDAESKKFASDIFIALGLTCPPNSPQGLRELGCFASLWMHAQRQIRSPPVLSQLWDRAVQEAKHVNKYKRSCKRPGAVWAKIFADMLSKRKAECKSISKVKTS